MSEDLMRKLYTISVRPHLEFAMAACNPYAQMDIDKLESVQRRATRLVPALRHLAYEERLQQLKLTTLAQRRVRGDLIQTYKILHNIENVNWFQPGAYRLNRPVAWSIDHIACVYKENWSRCVS